MPRTYAELQVVQSQILQGWCLLYNNAKFINCVPDISPDGGLTWNATDSTDKLHPNNTGIPKIVARMVAS
jgi:hypothetical protein